MAVDSRLGGETSFSPQSFESAPFFSESSHSHSYLFWKPCSTDQRAILIGQQPQLSCIGRHRATRWFAYLGCPKDAAPLLMWLGPGHRLRSPISLGALNYFHTLNKCELSPGPDKDQRQLGDMGPLTKSKVRPGNWNTPWQPGRILSMPVLEVHQKIFQVPSF